MRRHERMVMTLALAGGFVLVSCADQSGEETGDLSAIGEMEDVETRADTPPVKKAGSAAEIALEPLNESGVTGAVKVKEKEAGHEIAVRLDDATAEDGYVAHVHDGTCDDVGGVVLPLEDFRAAEDGKVKSATRAGDTELDPTANHLVQVHRADGTPVACAPIELGEHGAAGDDEAAPVNTKS